MTKKKAVWRDQRLLLVIIIIIMVVVFTIVNPKFVNWRNITSLFQQIAVSGILTMAMAMLLISGGLDLSIGNMLALSVIVMAEIIMAGGSLVWALLASVGTAVVCGIVNGVIVSKSRCVPLIVTLGTSQIFYGIALTLCGGGFLNLQEQLDPLRKASLFDILPVIVIIMAVVVVLMYLLINKTKFGRRIVAIGGNERNAYLSGINVDLYKIITYGISGLLVGIAGIIFGARLNAITATAGSGYELDAMVAAIIGGVTFEGGRGTVLGAFLGCLLIGVISNGLDIIGASAYTKIIITGAIIVIAVVLSNMDNIRKRV